MRPETFGPTLTERLGRTSPEAVTTCTRSWVSTVPICTSVRLRVSRTTFTPTMPPMRATAPTVPRIRFVLVITWSLQDVPKG